MNVGEFMKKRKKKYKLRYDRILFILIVFIAIIFLMYAFFIKDYTKDKLSKLGYNDSEIELISNNLNKNSIDILLKYDYLSYIIDLINSSEYDSNKLNSYITYIESIDNDNIDIDGVIYLINNDIDYEYSDKLINIVKSKYFIKDRLDRYMKYDSDSIEDIITNVNSNLDKEFYVDTEATDISKGMLMLVNKYYYLDSNYYYGELVTMDKAYDNKNGSKLNKEAYEAFKKLVDDGEKLGYHIRCNSGYRSYETQTNLYNNYKSNNGLTWADKWSARAGHSEHQTGLALDVGVKSEYSLSKFESSKEFTWMKENAHLYGFILRYPKGKEYITGYGYEPWHYRYVGVETATYIYENDITYEEYYAYFIEN